MAISDKNVHIAVARCVRNIGEVVDGEIKSEFWFFANHGVVYERVYFVLRRLRVYSGIVLCIVWKQVIIYLIE